jgi:gamma-glutamylcyclotransferase (GGCT)/AIG2-like uncharacterized protein YtfP
MTTYDPREDDDMLALQIDMATAAAEHHELATAEFDPTEYHDPEPRPFAVYGTLRPDCGADTMWTAIADCDPMDLYVIPGYRLTTNGGFPYAIPASNDESIVVNLIHPRDAAAAHALAERLDRYEGVPSHYQRIPVCAFAAQAPRAIRAWLYTPTHPDEAARLRSIPSGDWLTFLAANDRRWLEEADFWGIDPDSGVQP